MHKYLFTLLMICCVTLISLETNAQCAVLITDSVGTPLNPNGNYYAGQTVNICYTVGGFTQFGSNWFHGFVFDFGPGWDTSTLTITQAPYSCSGNGNWALYNQVISSASNDTFGMGVYFDFSFQPFFFPDGIPGNNFGDQNITNACSWTLCFSIMVDSNSHNESLFFGITPTGDGATGFWASDDCPGALDTIINTNVLSEQPCNMVMNNFIANPGCGLAQGAIDISVTSPFGTLSYIWSNGNTTEDLNSLLPGNYCLSVTDITGCQISNCFQLNFTDSMGASVSLTTPVSCFNYCDAVLTANPIYGIAPFLYQWSNSATDQVASNLCDGNFTVTVTDAIQCKDTISFSVTEPPNIVVDVTTVPVTCYGGANGSAHVDVQSGSFLTFQWIPSGQIGLDATNLVANDYDLIITDSYGCSTTQIVTISQSPRIKLGFLQDTVSCYGYSNGTIEAIPSLGIPNYTYKWSSPEWGNFQYTNKILNLDTGLYFITVTDANGCSMDSASLMLEPTQLEINFNSIPANCDISSDGALDATVFGGSIPYEYLWSISSTENQINGLNPGEYFLTVTDANNCSIEESSNVVAIPLYTLDAGPDLEVFLNYSVNISAYPSVYDNYYFTWSPLTGVSDPTDNTVSITPTITTTYTVYSTNANTGCVASDDLVITVLPNEDVFIPNAFSPNNDLVNNTIFPILGNGVQLASFKIYNRWGLKVYDGIDKFGWDGYYNNDLQEIGVYSYYCEYFIIDGTRKRKQGTILLMK